MSSSINQLDAKGHTDAPKNDAVNGEHWFCYRVLT